MITTIVFGPWPTFQAGKRIGQKWLSIAAKMPITFGKTIIFSRSKGLANAKLVSRHDIDRKPLAALE